MKNYRGKNFLSILFTKINILRKDKNFIMEENLTAHDIEYINEPFTEKDLKYIQEINQEKFGFFYNLNLEKGK